MKKAGAKPMKSKAGIAKAKTATSVSMSQKKAKAKKKTLASHYSQFNKPKSATAKKKGSADKRKTVRRARAAGKLSGKIAQQRARKYTKR